MEETRGESFEEVPPKHSRSCTAELGAAGGASGIWCKGSSQRESQTF